MAIMKSGKRIVCILIVLFLSLLMLYKPLFAPLFLYNGSDITKIDYTDSDLLLASNNWISYDKTDVVLELAKDNFIPDTESGAELSNEGVLLPADGIVYIEFDLTSEADVNIVFNLNVKSQRTVRANGNLMVNDEEPVKVNISTIWSDETKEYIKDRYGNDTNSNPKKLDVFTEDYLYNYASIEKSPVVFHLHSGKNRLVFENSTDSMILSNVKLVKQNKSVTYLEYMDNAAEINDINDVIVIEAEDYILKSDSYIRSGNRQNSALFPYDFKYKLLNILDGSSVNMPGQKIMWKFTIPKAGYYKLGFRYSQDQIEQLSCFRSVEIDGKIPYTELGLISFPYTGYKYDNLIANADGDELKIWLDQGSHTLALKSHSAPYQHIFDSLNEVITKINALSIEIRKITGNSKDTNRTWDMESYIPGLSDKLNKWAEELRNNYETLGGISNGDASFASSLLVAATNLEYLADEPDKIPTNMQKLNEGSSSSTLRIAEVVGKLPSSPANLDRIYIFNNVELSSPNPGFLQGVYDKIKLFFMSFNNETSGYSQLVTKDSKDLSVWINRPIHYVSLLEQLCDSKFTAKTGIKVNFSVMPNESKLILANASGTNPDIAMSVGNSTPFDLAIRGVAYDLTQYSDFFEYANKSCNIHTLLPFVYNDGVYGITETADFYIMLYRKDIFDGLNLEVPGTWDDVKGLLPKLKRYGMNFFVPVSSYSGTKLLYTTTPFFFQSNADIYKKGGASVDFTSDRPMEAFNLLTDLFTSYSMVQNVPSFYNNFRHGAIPIGIVNYSNYLLIKNAAPEIEEFWDVAPPPGVMDENGVVNRYQVACDKADLVFANSKKTDEAWKFLKWWLSSETQTEYGNGLLTRFGTDYLWNTANADAFKQLPYDSNTSNVVIEQWKNWTAEMQRHPASYIIEREISNVWSYVVVDGVDLRSAVEKAERTVNREMMRKLEEFGYIENNTLIKPYKIYSRDEFQSFMQQNE